MALYKEIKQDDGVVTKYHRILFVNIVTNSHNSIAVLSYVDGDSRMSSTDVQPYCRSATYEIAYDDTMTVENAYNYLKTLPQFSEAEDI